METGTGTLDLRVTREERRALGKAAREALPLDALADPGPDPATRDPLAILGAQDANRVPWLVPVRYGRMLRSPFAFYRGTAALMAHDLAPQPRSGLEVQLCGDAHLSNFGLYGSPERALVFDLNDFDETLPGPFEWDVKRLVASVVVAARDLGFKPKRQRAIALATAARYRTAMREFAELSALEAWYASLEVEDALQQVTDTEWRRFAAAVAERARGKDHLHAVTRFTEVVDGRRRIVADPPLIVPLGDMDPALLGGDPTELARESYADYLRTVRTDVRVLLDRFAYVDSALKVVGVGSVGTRCAIVLMQGADDRDLLFLQAKEAGPSVLEPHLGASAYAHPGERVVRGQRFMQSASDVFLGWGDGPQGRHYYWRQLRDWKGSADIDRMTPNVLERYGMVCGWTLAKAHARSGDRIALAAYLGSSARFEEALVEYACAYADAAERDFATLAAAVRDGRLEAHDDEERAR